LLPRQFHDYEFSWRRTFRAKGLATSNRSEVWMSTDSLRSSGPEPSHVSPWTAKRAKGAFEVRKQQLGWTKLTAGAVVCRARLFFSAI
jgi:hypothetical protein